MVQSGEPINHRPGGEPGFGGRPPGRQNPADFVLSNYSSSERKVLPFQVDRAADAVECLLTEGLEKTQSRFNS